MKTVTREQFETYTASPVFSVWVLTSCEHVCKACNEARAKDSGAVERAEAVQNPWDQIEGRVSGKAPVIEPTLIMGINHRTCGLDGLPEGGSTTVK